MKFKGKKDLLANDYKTIMIIEKNNKVECRTQSDEKGKKNIVGNFDKVLENCNDCEKVLLITNYFLDNNTIYYLEDNKYSEKYKSYFIDVIGSNLKKLSLSITHSNSMASQVVTNIINKFNSDRIRNIEKLLEFNPTIIIQGFENRSDYQVYNTKDSLEIDLHYLKRENEMAGFEYQFITNLLEDILNRTDDKIYYEENMSGDNTRNIRIYIDSHINIAFPSKKLRDATINIIDRHNELIKNNGKQLRLEDIHGKFNNGKNS